MKKLLLCSSMITAGLVYGVPPAHALNGPDSIEIDGGPLGSLQISGGTDGYGYYVSGTGNADSPNYIVGDKSDGAYVSNYLLEVQKNTGVLQATVIVGATSSVSLGTEPLEASFDNISPLYEGYVTIAPKPTYNIEVGQIPSLEGYESLPDWSNANMLASLLYYTQNTVSRGAMVNWNNAAETIYTSLEFSDGYRTGVFNYLQGLASYSWGNGATAAAYGAWNLGRSGPNTVGAYGPINGGYEAEYNSNMVGAYFYGYPMGNLTLVPEVQYQWSKPDAILGIPKTTSNFGALLIAEYKFGETPYSLGGFVEYATSNGSSTDWFIGPNAGAVGISVAPTWQRRNIFARFNAGYMYLTNNKADGVTYGYGASNTGKSQFTGILEAGVLF